MTILVLEGLHGQTRHLVAVNSSTQQINYGPCLDVKILTKQDLQTHFSLLVPEWRNWRPWFPRHLSCFGQLLRYKIYSIQNQRHQCHHRARRSLQQQHLACFLLSGSPGQAPILHCSVQGRQQGQAHIISLVKILAPNANHIIIPYSCARHKARTSKKQQQIKFSKPEHWFFTQSVIPGHHCFGQDFSFNMQIITLYHIPALIIKPKQVKYNKKSHFLILNIDFIFRASFRDNWFQEKAVK